MKRAELIMAGLLLVVSLAYGFEAFRYPYTGRVGAGAGFLPVWTSVVGVITSLLLLGRAWRLAGPSAGSERLFAGRIVWLGPLIVGLGLFLWALTAWVLSGIVAIAAFVFAVTWWLAGREDRVGAQRLVVAGITTVVVTLSVFLIFQVWLDIRLPPGIFGDRV